MSETYQNEKLSTQFAVACAVVIFIAGTAFTFSYHYLGDRLLNAGEGDQKVSVSVPLFEFNK